jgi:uncharacterized RDD family membrane protein YckC
VEAGAATSVWPEGLAGRSVASPQPAPVTGASRQADEAIRWRLNAAIADFIIQVAILFVVILALAAQGIALNFWAAAAMGLAGSWLYHFLFESHGGQTPGKKRFGVKVVRVDGGPAEPWRIALRNLLRGVDEFGPLSASGLITMWLSGPAHRQRIGDKAAGTLVVPVSGRDRRRPSPRWLLPALASLSILLGIGEVSRVVHASSTRGSSLQTNFVARCSATAPPNESCACLYRYLHERAGYRTAQQWSDLERRVGAAVAAHDLSRLPPDYVAAALACRTG